MGNVRQTRSGSALFLSILLAVTALAFWRCGTEDNSNVGADGGTNNGTDAGNSISNVSDAGVFSIGDAGTIGGGPVQ